MPTFPPPGLLPASSAPLEPLPLRRSQEPHGSGFAGKGYTNTSKKPLRAREGGGGDQSLRLQEQSRPRALPPSRESLYRLLPQTTPENINKNFEQYTLDPGTRYPNLNSHCVRPHQVSPSPGISSGPPALSGGREGSPDISAHPRDQGHQGSGPYGDSRGVTRVTWSQPLCGPQERSRTHVSGRPHLYIYLHLFVTMHTMLLSIPPSIYLVNLSPFQHHPRVLLFSPIASQLIAPGVACILKVSRDLYLHLSAFTSGWMISTRCSVSQVACVPSLGSSGRGKEWPIDTKSRRSGAQALRLDVGEDWWAAACSLLLVGEAFVHH